MLGSLFSAGAGLLGGLLGKDSAEDAAEKNAALQREFAQNSIQWRVKDAKAAGVHPLYALGAPTMSASPSYVGDTSLPSAMASVGQDIGSAIDRTRTAPQKVDAVQRTAQALELERAGLQNDLLRAQIRETTARSAGPAFPSAVDPYLIPGQGDSPVKPSALVSDKAMERIRSAHGHEWSEPAAVSDVGFSKNAYGGYSVLPSKDAKDRMEDMMFPEIAWAARNYLGPLIKYHPGFDNGKWIYNPLDGAYYPYDGN